MRILSIFAGALAVTLLAAPPVATAQQNQQQNQQQQKKKPPAQKQKQGAQQQQHRQGAQQRQQHQQHQQQQIKKQNVQQQPKVIQQQKVQQQKFQQNNNNKKTVIINNNKPPKQVTFKANRQTFTGTKARAWNRNNGNWNLRGRNYSYWRGGPWRHRYNGGWRTYVALSALTAIAVGSATYYPYAYVEVPENVCEGITEDGCQLSWTEVETQEGGLAPACVTYCPWE